MKKVVLVLIAAGSILSSCNKEEKMQIPTEPVDIKELKVGNHFDWNAAKTYEIEIIGYANSVLKIKDMDGNILHQAMLTKNVGYKTILQLPAHQKTVKAEFLGNSYEISLDNTNIQFTLN
ncbi:hypothetical protein JCM31826_15930 [Thermaurantimonas aggregans]|uniref:Lipoprotein n=1 Tax=Thermaurantimonas aggregans TaxID=2173829 RepID=A0A401XM97_9FLAO|nr:hypothetical protein [Thermaurantimonas aggregans]MCX8147981.1 hypothetical protein [Thermaurantimonas aggregans]GCD78111.1 hypothetical protein JCM31826_15930 [Thermaurantimonas aggregans]